MIDRLFIGMFSVIQKTASLVRRSKWLQGVILLITFGVMVYSGLSLLFTSIVILMMVLFVHKPMWGVYFLAIFIPVKFALKQEFMTPLQAAVIIPLVLLFVVFSALSGGNSKEITATDKYLVLMLLASMVSCIGAVMLHGARIAMILDFIVWLQLVGFYLLGRSVVKEKPINEFIGLNLIVGNVVAFVAIIQSLFQTQGYSPWIDAFEKITYRVTGFVGNPNALAGYLMMVILLGLVLLVKTKKPRQFMVILALFIPVGGMVLTYSRGAIIALIIGVIILLLQRKKWNWLMLGAGILLLLGTLFWGSIGERFMNIVSPNGIEYSQDSGRIWSLNNVLYINRNHFLFGNGWGSYGGEYGYRPLSPTYLEGVQGGNVTVANTDNQWLQVYAQQGVVGLWLYFLIIIGITRTRFREPLFACLLAFMCWGLFVDSFQFYQASFFGFLTLGILATKNRNDVVE